jgi:hypothetical protein
MKLPNFTNAIMEMDLGILRLVMRATHWIDYRFHVNQYRLAAWVLSFGLACNFAANISGLIKSGFQWAALISLLGVVSSIMMILLYTYWLKMLEIASRKYERDPMAMPREAAFFIIPIFPPVRMAFLWFGLVVEASEVKLAITTPTGFLILSAALNNWMWIIALALYIAGGIPPRHDRKEKRAWQPLPVTTPA